MLFTFGLVSFRSLSGQSPVLVAGLNSAASFSGARFCTQRMVLPRVLRRARRPSEEADVPNRDLDSPGQGRRDSPGQGRLPPRAVTNKPAGTCEQQKQPQH